jgi:hypothetical protein
VDDDSFHCSKYSLDESFVTAEKKESTADADRTPGEKYSETGHTLAASLVNPFQPFLPIDLLLADDSNGHYIKLQSLLGYFLYLLFGKFIPIF